MAPPQVPIPNATLEPLDISNTPKPFKKNNWKPPVRRNKNLKQMLADAQRSLINVVPVPTTTTTADPTILTSTPTGTDTPTRTSSTKTATPATSSTIGNNVGPTYTNIEATPSLHPARAHWCDITGLPARYTDPKTKLRYANKEVYEAIRSLPPGSADQYLALRGANVILK